MDTKKRNMLLRRLIFITIGLVIIIGMFRYVGPETVRDKLVQADLVYIGLAFILLFAVMVIKIVRWSTLFPELSFTNAGKVFSIGQVVNETAPIGTGELTRGFVARTKFGISFGKTLAPALIERISDVTFLFALTLMFLMIIFTGESYYFILTFVIILLAVVYLLLFRPRYIGSLTEKLNKFSVNRGDFVKRVMRSITRFSKSFQEALLKFHTRQAILGSTIGLTILAWTIEAFGQWTLIQAFGFGANMNFFSFLSIVGASWIIGTFSFLPGGLGAREIAFASLLSETQSIPFEDGFAIAIVYRLLAYTLLVSFAAASFATLPKEDAVKKARKFKKLRVLRK